MSQRRHEPRMCGMTTAGADATYEKGDCLIQHEGIERAGFLVSSSRAQRRLRLFFTTAAFVALGSAPLCFQDVNRDGSTFRELRYFRGGQMDTGRPTFDRIVKRVFRICHLSRGEALSERRRAIKDGRLVDMQLQPFRQFNQILNINFPLVMTRAAYRASIELPGETRKKNAFPANGRWGFLYLRFVETFQQRADNSEEGTFDVYVMLGEGFQVPRVIKVLLDHDFDGEEAFLFTLPDESWPDLLTEK